MKARNSKRSDKFTPKYPTKGYTTFEIGGTVQSVIENDKNKVDYVTFYVTNKTIRPNNYQRIQVSIPHSLNVLLEEGDAVYVIGEIISFWNEDSGHSELRLEATQVLDKNETPMSSAISDDCDDIFLKN